MAARAALPPLRLGVASDLSGPYAALGGRGSGIAAEMAAEDFGGTVLGRKIEVLQGDTQNKPDIASVFVREWFDRQGVEAVLDGSASSVGFAIQQLAQQRGKVFLDSGSFSSEFIGKSCTPTTLQYIPNTRALAVAGLTDTVKSGTDTWFFITPDYTFGHVLQKDATSVIEANGGRVLGFAKHPLGTADLSSYLIQAKASGAKGLALANAGSDLINTIKQFREFGLADGKMKVVGLLMFSTDIEGLGLEAAQGLQFSTASYWAMDDKTRDWGKRFMARNGGHPPSMVHMTTYSAALHYLKVVQALGDADGVKVAAKLHETPVDDLFTHHASVRADGRVMGELHVARVPSPAEAKDPRENMVLLGTLPAEALYPTKADSECPLFKQ